MKKSMYFISMSCHLGINYIKEVGVLLGVDHHFN